MLFVRAFSQVLFILATFTFLLGSVGCKKKRKPWEQDRNSLNKQLTSVGHQKPVVSSSAPTRSSLPKGHTALVATREPSGAVALPQKGGILVVDDEPKRAPQGLGIFFYKVRGKTLTHLPLVQSVRQKRRWSDWEGVTATPTHAVLMTSHSKHKKKRTQICRFPLSALKVGSEHVTLSRKLECSGGKFQRRQLLSLLTKASQKHGWRLSEGWKQRGAKQGGLDMEAITYLPIKRVFLIGLRGPLAHKGGKSWAITLAMRWGGHQPHFRYAGIIQLKHRGIRGWQALPKGGLVLSAGPVGSIGPFALYTLKKIPQMPFEIPGLTPIPKLPINMPRAQLEGLAIWKDRLFLFRDTGHWRRHQSASVLSFSIKKWIPWISSR